MLQKYVRALPQHEIEAAAVGYHDRFAEQTERHNGTADVVAQGEGARAIEARLIAPTSRE